MNLRPSPIAGQWYESNPGKLARSIDGYLDQAKLTDPEGEVIGVIAPHAGHIYSGKTAGYAFKAISHLKPELVVILAPSHHYLPASILTSAHDAYATPLGNVVVDKEFLARMNEYLSRTQFTEVTPVANDSEHSLEIELPFLQRIYKHPFKLVPIMIRDRNLGLCKSLAECLAELYTPGKFIVVASTDLSHFYSQSEAGILDRRMLSAIRSFSPETVHSTEESGTGFACGLPAVSTALSFGKLIGADKVDILHYSTSAEVTGDYSSVVGYGAAAIIKSQ